MSVFRPEFIEALTLLAKACDDVVAKGYDRPVLVGGAAVEFHTRSAVTSGDFDFVTQAHEAFEKILPKYGFEEMTVDDKLMKTFINEKLGLAVEVISDTLFSGRSDVQKIRLVDVIDGNKIAISPVEDLIADRLGQHSEGLSGMLDQAIAMFRLAFDLDEAYLDRRIREETCGELDLAYLKERSK